MENNNDNTNRLDDGQQVKKTRRKTSTSAGASKQPSIISERAKPDAEPDGAGHAGRSPAAGVLESQPGSTELDDDEFEQVVHENGPKVIATPVTFKPKPKSK
jgi:hypothetical protein